MRNNFSENICNWGTCP